MGKLRQITLGASLLLFSLFIIGCPDDGPGLTKIETKGPFVLNADAVNILEQSYHGYTHDSEYYDVKLLITVEDRTQPLELLLSPFHLTTYQFEATVDDKPIDDLKASFFRGEFEESYQAGETDFIRFSIYHDDKNNYVVSGVFVFEDKFYELFVKEGQKNIGSVAKRISDEEVRKLRGSCGAVHAELFQKNNHVGKSVVNTESVEGVRQLKGKLPLEADALLYEKFNHNAAYLHGYMLSVMNNVAGLYETQMTTPVVLSIDSSNINTVESVISSKTNSQGVLDDFRLWGQAKYGNSGTLIHLFTGRNLDGTIIGIAWGDALCTGYRYGISQYRLEEGVFQAMALTGHELGHNFAMPHDEDCSFNDVNKRYMMCPSLFLIDHVFSAKSLETSSVAIENAFWYGCLQPQY